MDSSLGLAMADDPAAATGAASRSASAEDAPGAAVDDEQLRLLTPEPPTELDNSQAALGEDVAAGSGLSEGLGSHLGVNLSSPILRPLHSPSLSASRAPTAPGSGGAGMSLDLDEMGEFALNDAATAAGGALQSPAVGASPAGSGTGSLPMLPGSVLSQLSSPPLAPLNRSAGGGGERAGRPRDVDEDEDGYEDAEQGASAARPSKKQRRVSTHPPPPMMSPASSSSAYAAAAAASPPPSHALEDDPADQDEDSYASSVGEGSEVEQEDAEGEEEDEEGSAADGRSDGEDSAPPSQQQHSSLPRIASADQLLSDPAGLASPTDDGEPRIGTGAPLFGSPSLEGDEGVGGVGQSMFGGSEDVSIQQAIIDLTDEDAGRDAAAAAAFDASLASGVASPAAAAATAAASTPGFPGASRQSITSSLFGGGGSAGLLPSSSFQAFPNGIPPPPRPAKGGAAAAAGPAAAAAAAPSNQVDLSANSDDDEASDNKLGTVLCLVYGTRLCPGKAAVRETVVLVRLTNGADQNAIRVDNLIEQPCGVLNKDTAAALSPLIDKKFVRVEARVGTLSESEMGLRIDLYGRSRDRKAIERHLRKFPMVNYLSLHDPQPKRVGAAGPGGHAGLDGFLQAHGSAGPALGSEGDAGSQGKTVREIESDLDSLFGGAIDLALMPLAETPSSLRTQLHPYQRQGLAWMLQHEEPRTLNLESSELLGWTKLTSNVTGKVTYYNKLTKESQSEAPRLACGGLLADEMGLGKTLQVLSLVATSLTKGVSTASDGSNKLKFKTGSARPHAPTLIVCPLSVITNWEQQVLHHFNPSTPLSYYTYHGPSRSRDVQALRGYDLIITTYNILAQEFEASQAALGLEDAEDDSDDEDDDPFKSLQKKRKTPAKKKKQTAGAMAAAAALAAANEADTEALAAGGRPKAAPLFEIDFFRVILDEAHSIRTRQSLQSRAARALKGERRWALSGTPLVNKVDDAFALLNFLRVPPFTSHSMWQRLIARPLKARDPKGMQRLQQVMGTICLRRKKNEEINGKRILILPDKTQRTRMIQLTGKEKALYDTLSASGRRQFQQLLQSDTVLRHYAYVLEILLRMRQACNHSMLVPEHYHQHGFAALADAAGDKAAELRRLVALLEESVADECGMCRKLAEDPVITQCCHFFCRKCIDSYTEQPAYHNAVYEAQFLPPGAPPPQPNNHLYCPQCRQQLDKSLIIGMHHRELLRLEEEQKQAAALHARGHATLSPKLLALLEELQRVLNLGDKAIVFSQWTSFLNILQACLQQANVKHVRLDGQMSAANRAKALKSFEDDDTVKVFLISLKAGGVGLNLTSANHVFLLDPWWNPATEDQAIDRVHRLGQTKPVEVVRFICADSVEEKILELQNSKREMTTTALARSSRSQEDQKQERLQDLITLFN